MPTRNVNLTPQLDRFITATVKRGRYDNASEVVRAALRTLQREEKLHKAQLAALRAAIAEGDSSGLVTGDVFAQIRSELGIRPRRRR